MRPPDSGLAAFEAHRPRLVRLAYRMLGSASEAEDVVQNAWVRWQAVSPDAVREPAAFLTRIVSRLCLDELKSARARRETYVGSWLPEPIADVQVGDAEGLDAGDDITLALMVAMERLSPLERAAFLLHDVFGVAFEEVAATLDRDAAAVRQLAARARKHVQAARPRFPASRDEGDRIAQAFIAASRSGDVSQLGALLAHDVILRSDGGGQVRSYPNAISGKDRVVRLLAGLARKGIEPSGARIQPVWLDGLPGYAGFGADNAFQTTALAIDAGLITGIFITRNPDKLSAVTEALAGR